MWIYSNYLQLCNCFDYLFNTDISANGRLVNGNSPLFQNVNIYNGNGDLLYENTTLFVIASPYQSPNLVRGQTVIYGRLYFR